MELMIAKEQPFAVVVSSKRDLRASPSPAKTLDSRAFMGKGNRDC